jgi:hypothetical protein
MAMAKMSGLLLMGLPVPFFCCQHAISILAFATSGLQSLAWSRTCYTLLRRS